MQADLRPRAFSNLGARISPTAVKSMVEICYKTYITMRSRGSGGSKCRTEYSVSRTVIITPAPMLRNLYSAQSNIECEGAQLNPLETSVEAEHSGAVRRWSMRSKLVTAVPMGNFGGAFVGRGAWSFDVVPQSETSRRHCGRLACGKQF